MNIINAGNIIMNTYVYPCLDGYIMSDKSMPTLKRGQNSFEGGCSTVLAWIFCKLMRLVGKAEHRFPVIEEKHNDRFIEITKNNKAELEEILQGKILFTPGHTADTIYPAHGHPFSKSDLAKYKNHISKICLYKLN